jgi:hypothetical protein
VLGPASRPTDPTANLVEISRSRRNDELRNCDVTKRTAGCRARADNLAWTWRLDLDFRPRPRNSELSVIALPESWRQRGMEAGLNSDHASSEGTTGTTPVKGAKVRPEVGVLPVGDGYEVVPPTPPDSAYSSIFGTGLPVARPGSFDGLPLTAYDARADLIAFLAAERRV